MLLVVEVTLHVVHLPVVDDATAVGGHDTDLAPIPALQVPAQNQAEWREQQKEPHCVGDEAGYKKQHARQQQAHRIEQLIRRHVPRGHLFLHSPQHAQTLAFDENRTERGNEEQQGNRGEDPEPRADLDQCVNLAKRQCNEDDEEDGHWDAG